MEENRETILEDKVKEYLLSTNKTIDEAILEEGTAVFKERTRKQFMEDRAIKKGSFYASSAGKCPRQNWYKFRGYPEERFDRYETRLKFWFGDLVEVGVAMLLKLAVGDDFKTDDISCKRTYDYGDGIQRNIIIDGLYKNEAVCECKSMNDRQYAKFVSNGMDNEGGYLTQINIYMDAWGLDKTILFGVNKDKSKFHEQIIKKDMKYIVEARERFKIVLGEDLPSRAHAVKLGFVKMFEGEPKGWLSIEDPLPWKSKFTFIKHSRLSWQCEYCGHLVECWKDEFKQKFVDDKPMMLKEEIGDDNDKKEA